MAKGDTYIPLANYFEKLGVPVITLTFDEIASILGFPLPPSAAKHNRWWMNDPGHSQAVSWLGAGYQKSHLDMENKKVTFIKE